MIFNMTGGGGGLNLTVKAYASEAAMLSDAPAENTIGVVTTTMTDWCLQADEPQNPAAGLVWVKLGTSSTTPISVSRTKTVMCYPISAKEWDGSAWVTLTAKCWQNGMWRLWTIEWFMNGVSSHAYTLWGSYGYMLGDPTIRLGSTNGWDKGAVYDYIDISPFSTIYAEIKPNNTGERVGVGVGTVLPNGSYNGVTDSRQCEMYSVCSGNTQQTISLDIANVSGEKYVSVISGNGWNQTAYCTLYRWWMV